MTVKMDKKAGIGDLSCKICGQNFQTGINCKTRSSSCVNMEAWLTAPQISRQLSMSILTGSMPVMPLRRTEGAKTIGVNELWDD